MREDEKDNLKHKIKTGSFITEIKKASNPDNPDFVNARIDMLNHLIKDIKNDEHNLIIEVIEKYLNRKLKLTDIKKIKKVATPALCSYNLYYSEGLLGHMTYDLEIFTHTFKKNKDVH